MVPKHGVNMGWIAKNCHQAVTPHEVGHMFGCAHNKGRTKKYMQGYSGGLTVELG